MKRMLYIVEYGITILTIKMFDKLYDVHVFGEWY